jgi:hypothetical protein
MMPPSRTFRFCAEPSIAQPKIKGNIFYEISSNHVDSTLLNCYNPEKGNILTQKQSVHKRPANEP